MVQWSIGCTAPHPIHLIILFHALLEGNSGYYTSSGLHQDSEKLTGSRNFSNLFQKFLIQNMVDERTFDLPICDICSLCGRCTLCSFVGQNNLLSLIVLIFSFGDGKAIKMDCPALRQIRPVMVMG